MKSDWRTILIAMAAFFATLLLAVFALKISAPTRVVSIDLPPQAANSEPEVGPLGMDTGMKLRVTTLEFEAEISETGLVSRQFFAHAQAERVIALDSATFRRLREDLGRLKASWSARKVGEDASLVHPPDTAASVTAPAETAIVIREIRRDGGERLLIAVSPTAPEYAELEAALTPIRGVP